MSTNFIAMQLIEEIVEDNKALRAELARQQQQQQQQQQQHYKAFNDVLARVKAMCVTNSSHLPSPPPPHPPPHAHAAALESNARDFKFNYQNLIRFFSRAGSGCCITWQRQRWAAAAAAQF